MPALGTPDKRRNAGLSDSYQPGTPATTLLEFRRRAEWDAAGLDDVKQRILHMHLASRGLSSRRDEDIPDGFRLKTADDRKAHADLLDAAIMDLVRDIRILYLFGLSAEILNRSITDTQ
jgi:hypothetical protein